MGKTVDQKITLVSELEIELTTTIATLADTLSVPLEDRDLDQMAVEISSINRQRKKLAKAIRSAQEVLSSNGEMGIKLSNQVKKAQRDLTKSRIMVRHWGRFEPILNAQLEMRQVDFMEEDIVIPMAEATVFDHMSELFFTSLHRVANPTGIDKSDEAEELGCHKDIPLTIHRFSNLISAAHRVCLAMGKDRPLRFLDVGSGGGSKVLAATTCFEECHGLEYDKNSVANGQEFLKLLSPGSCKLIHGDALTFGDYGQYDVIYHYRPLIETEKMQQMEARIFDQVKPGTVLVAVDVLSGGLLSEDLQARNVQQLAERIYVTGKTPAEAEVIKNRVRCIGTDVRGFHRKQLPKLGYWEPLAKASTANGYIV